MTRMPNPLPPRESIADIARAILVLTLAGPRSNVMVTAPTTETARLRLDRIEAALPEWAIARVSRTNDAARIELKDGTTIRACGRNRPGYARGYSLALAVIDDHITIDEMRELTPAFATTGGQILTLND